MNIARTFGAVGVVASLAAPSKVRRWFALRRTLVAALVACILGGLGATPALGQFAVYNRSAGYQVDAIGNTSTRHVYSYTLADGNLDVSDSVSVPAVNCYPAASGSAAMTSFMSPGHLLFLGSGNGFSGRVSACGAGGAGGGLTSANCDFTVAQPTQVVFSYEVHATNSLPAYNSPRTGVGLSVLNGDGNLIVTSSGPVNFVGLTCGCYGAMDAAASQCVTLLPGHFRLQSYDDGSINSRLEADWSVSWSVRAELTATSSSAPTASATPSCASGSTTVVASNLPPNPTAFQWQWKPDGAPAWGNIGDGVIVNPATGQPITVTGSQAQSLFLTGAGREAALYRCVVTNACGSVTSNPATLTISSSPPTITQQPASASACLGGSGAPFVTYDDGIDLWHWQWQPHGVGPWFDLLDGLNYDPATSLPALTVDSASGPIIHAQPDPLMYPVGTSLGIRCIVANACGSVISDPATLIANSSPPTVTQQPVNATVCPTGVAGYSFEAWALEGPFTYQWSWRPTSAPAWSVLSEGLNVYPGFGEVEVHGTRAIPLVVHAHGTGGSFRMAVTNACGTTTSDAAALTICAADFNCSGTLEVADIFAFLNAWFAGDPRTDFDGINGLQVADIFAFLNAWFAGC